MAFRLIPKILGAVNVVLLLGKVWAVIDAKMCKNEFVLFTNSNDFFSWEHSKPSLMFPGYPGQPQI